MAQAEQELEPSTRTTVDHIHDEILQRICFAHYLPGDQLKEATLAKEFGVSRTPVRDAIARIGHLGLVETRNGVGTVVIELSSQRIRHLYEMRMVLATLIGELSPAEIQDHHREEAHSIHQHAVELKERNSSQEFVRINQRLQTLISALIGNVLLREFWNQAYFQATSVWHRMAQDIGPTVYDALIDETSDLLIALDRKDIAAVGYLQRVHIGYGFQLIEKHLLVDSDTTNGSSRRGI